MRDAPSGLTEVGDWIAAPCRPDGGLGTLARLGNVVLLVADAPNDQVYPLLDHARMVAANGGEARQLVRGFALLVSTMTEEPPAFAAIGPHETGIAVFAYGGVVVEADTTDGKTETIDGRQSFAWTERVIEWPIRRLAATVNPGENVQAPRESLADSVHDLRDGVVASSGFTVYARDMQQDDPDHSKPKRPPIPPSQEPPDDQRDPENTNESIILTDEDPDDEQRPPLPIPGGDPVVDVQSATPPSVPEHVKSMARGVICANGHFNDPRKLFCGICGVNMVQRTPVLVEDVRPPLGVLVIDDGSVFQLDTHYLIGREPESDERAHSGKFRCIEINDRANKISRVHAVLELRNWDVVLSDDASTNGTFLMPKDTTEWRRIPAGSEEVLVPGSRIRLGDRTLAFTTHQGR